MKNFKCVFYLCNYIFYILVRNLVRTIYLGISVL